MTVHIREISVFLKFNAQKTMQLIFDNGRNFILN